ncbi:PfkB family carbohydrate kinase [Endothiovibrio diazotrophicus]
MGELEKFRRVDVLAELIADEKTRGKVVALCHGVFDLLHPGHIRHLQAARRECDVLVVSITTDRYVNKGPGRPAFNETLRVESLSALGCVDYVTISDCPSAVEVIHALQPSVYVKGSEYADKDSDVTGKIRDEEQAILSVGGRVLFTDELTFSSSHLINAYLNVFPPETERWLARFREKHSLNGVLTELERVRGLRPLVVGEAIIDEYVFCDGLGKSNKDPMLAFLERSRETYAGGALAVANHLAGICGEVGLLTALGSDRSREEFVRNSLAGNIAFNFVEEPGVPTIHKRRYVDSYTGTRLFETYQMEDSPLDGVEEQRFIERLEAIVGDYDLVVVADYGHGLISQRIVSKLVELAPFLAVNTQANAGNRGYNLISKYPKANYVSLATHEVSLEVRDKYLNWEALLARLGERIDCRHFTVTRGREGSSHFTKGEGVESVPSLATTVSDRVGAGDAVFAVTSLLVKSGAPWEVVGFLGNLAGAEMVGDLGNRNAISVSGLTKHVTALMK